MSLTALLQLPGEFRAKAGQARAVAASEVAAHVWETAANELEARIQASDFAPLELEDASRESGYTVSQLRRLVKDGKIPNAVKEGYAIHRCNLPRKPGFGVANPPSPAPSSRVQAARAVLRPKEAHGDS